MKPDHAEREVLAMKLMKEIYELIGNPPGDYEIEQYNFTLFPGWKNETSLLIKFTNETSLKLTLVKKLVSEAV